MEGPEVQDEGGTMEGQEVQDEGGTSRSKAQQRNWILFVLVAFGCFCILQALSIYSRVGLENNNQLTVEERDALRRQRDALKQKLQCIKNHTSQGWLFSQESLYLVTNTRREWNQCREFCQERGADLLIITSREEQEYVNTAVRGLTWLGLSDQEQEDVWKWVDGSALNMSFWASGEPNDEFGKEDCAEMYFNKNVHNWNDSPCSFPFACACEKQTDVSDCPLLTAAE